MPDTFAERWMIGCIVLMFPFVFLMVDLMTKVRAPIWTGLIGGALYGAVMVAPALIETWEEK